MSEIYDSHVLNVCLFINIVSYLRAVDVELTRDTCSLTLNAKTTSPSQVKSISAHTTTHIITRHSINL
jgi:hypothetical protein